MVSLLPKTVLYRLLTKVQTQYNDTGATYCNIVLTDVDQIRMANLDELQATKLGGIDVFIPKITKSISIIIIPIFVSTYLKRRR